MVDVLGVTATEDPLGTGQDIIVPPLPEGYEPETVAAPVTPPVETPPLPDGYELQTPEVEDTPEGPVVTPVSFYHGVAAPEATAEDDAEVDRSSVGAIMDAFLQGGRDGFGKSDLGLSAKSHAELSELGVFRDVNDAGIQPLRFLNESLVRPVAVVIDGLFRSVNAGIYGVSNAAGAFVDETGISSLVGLPGKRLTRDLIGLTEAAGIVLGNGPVRSGPRMKHSITKVDSQPTKATRPFKDLDSDPPPATTTITRSDTAGNINLNKIEAGEDVKDVIRSAALASDDFMEQRRGVVSHHQTGELADALGMTPTELTKTKIGTSFNAHEIDAARDLLINSADDVRNLAVKAERGTDADIVNLQEGVLRHLAIQESVAGITAEAGRALNAFKKKKASTLDAKGIEDLLVNAGGRDAMRDTIEKMKQFNSPQQLSKYIRDSKKATSGDMVIEAWINGLLSGPTTHVVNAASNTLNSAVFGPLESLVSAGVSAAKGAKGADRVFFGEAAQRLYGFGQGARDGLRVGWRAFKTEEASSIHTKLEQPRQKSIPSKTIKIGERKFEVGGKQVRLPGRLLTASDEFFKAIGYRQELNAHAYRIASSEGLKGSNKAQRIAELVSKPTKEMQDAATTTAHYQTFTKPLGEVGQAVQKISNAHPLLKIPFTFIRTPTNIVKYAGERTVLSVLSKKVRANLTGKKGSVAQSEQISRIIVGSGIGYTAWSLAEEGLITGGGPKDPRERALRYANGWMPYSVRIGDMYYSYARFEPLGMLMGTVADANEISDKLSDTEVDDVAALVTASIAKNVLSKTWTRGASDLVEAVSDPVRYGERYIQRLAGTLIPTGAAQLARAIDPELKEVRSITDAIQARLPFASKSVGGRFDVWGERIVTEGAIGPDILSPVYQSRF